jgi:hypothetical protein
MLLDHSDIDRLDRQFRLSSYEEIAKAFQEIRGNILTGLSQFWQIKLRWVEQLILALRKRVRMLRSMIPSLLGGSGTSLLALPRQKRARSRYRRLSGKSGSNRDLGGRIKSYAGFLQSFLHQPEIPWGTAMLHVDDEENSFQNQSRLLMKSLSLTRTGSPIVLTEQIDCLPVISSKRFGIGRRHRLGKTFDEKPRIFRQTDLKKALQLHLKTEENLTPIEVTGANGMNDVISSRVKFEDFFRKMSDFQKSVENRSKQ